MLALLFNHLGSSFSSSVRSDPDSPVPLPLEDYVFCPTGTLGSPAPWCAAGREGPGGGTAGTVALQAGSASEGWLEPWGKGVDKAVEVRMQALRRKKPDQGGGYTRAKLESLP